MKKYRDFPIRLRSITNVGDIVDLVAGGQPGQLRGWRNRGSGSRFVWLDCEARSLRKLVAKCININPRTPATHFSKILTLTLHDFHDFHEFRENRENREMHAPELCFSFEAEWLD